MPRGTWMPTSLNGVPTICLRKLILQVAPAILKNFAGRELVFTLRTRSEGGEIDLSPEEYIHLIKEVAQLYQPDYIDF